MTRVTTPLDEALEAWADARVGFIREVRNIPAKHWDYRPTPEVRSVHEMCIHILEVAMLMVDELTRPDGSFRRKPFARLIEPHTRRARRSKTRAQALRSLKAQQREGARAFRDAGELHMLQLITRFDGQPGTRMAWLHHGIAQEEYHRGQIATYARLLGIEPALTRLIRGG